MVSPMTAHHQNRRRPAIKNSGDRNEMLHINNNFKSNGLCFVFTNGFWGYLGTTFTKNNSKINNQEAIQSRFNVSFRSPGTFSKRKRFNVTLQFSEKLKQKNILKYVQ